ncbi:MAG: hypothetical protein HQ515_01340 [Phycisphaeraceae bacterium]|nr:hypothetical protein [Phycisphaeraceae bacterium]
MRPSDKLQWSLIFTILILSGCGIWAGSTQDTPGITIFLTGQDLGALKPCGCSGGQLGGLERRGALWEAVDPATRLVVNTGHIVPSESEQNLIKYPVFLQAYQMLGYDLVNLTGQDLQIGTLAGAVEIVEALGMQPITTQGDEYGMVPSYSRVFTVDQQSIQVNVIAVDATYFEHLDTLETPGVTLFILNDANETLLETVMGQADVQDCVVYPEAMDEPKCLQASGPAGPMVVSIGQRGRYVCQLKLALSTEMKTPQLAFSFSAVSEDLVGNQAVKGLYKDYQQIVATSQLQETFLRVPLSQGTLAFQGSASCKACHAEEYRIWNTHQHAHAFATLVKAGSQRDPECTVCHVVGMEYDVGYLTEADTPHLKDVGCEVCHGPGSEHNRSMGEIRTQGPKMTCLDCHTPEHSGGYAGHEQEFLEKIKHWKEPKPVRTVKE